MNFFNLYFRFALILAILTNEKNFKWSQNILHTKPNTNRFHFLIPIISLPERKNYRSLKEWLIECENTYGIYST